MLGTAVGGLDDDFFAHGGGSLAAAQLVSLLRRRYPSVTVADVYANPRLGDLADVLGDAGAGRARSETRAVAPMARSAQAMQILITLVVSTISGLQWVTVLAALNNLLAHSGHRPLGADHLVVVGARRRACSC